MLHRVIYNTDDSVMVMSPNPEVRLKGETEAEQLERFYQKHLVNHPQHDGLSYEDMDTSAIPSGRAERGRWRKKAGGGIKVDNSVVLPKEARASDKALLKAEQKKAQPNLKTALDLMIKLTDNNY